MNTKMNCQAYLPIGLSVRSMGGLTTNCHASCLREFGRMATMTSILMLSGRCERVTALPSSRRTRANMDCHSKAQDKRCQSWRSRRSEPSPKI